jgi:hypothetical protein
MNRNFTLKLLTFLSLVLLGSQKVNSQACTSQPTTNCVAVTDQFTMASFGQTSGDFQYNSGLGAYSAIKGNEPILNIISYTLTIQSNVFSVGAQITSGLDRINREAVIRILNPATNALICQAVVQVQDNGCLSAQFGGLNGQDVRVGFRFTRRANGGVALDNFGTDPAQAALPVTFTSFEGRRVANGIQLTWKVADEINVQEYQVERSLTGNNGFTKIGTVSAKGYPSYTFTDEAPVTGQVFYRVKNMDNDGRFDYSSEISFKNGISTPVFRVFPTLVTAKTDVHHGTVTGNDAITLSTADGRMVRSLRPAAGSLKTTVEMGDLRAGLYILRYRTSNGTVETVKLVKQ